MRGLLLFGIQYFTVLLLMFTVSNAPSIRKK